MGKCVLAAKSYVSREGVTDYDGRQSDCGGGNGIDDDAGEGEAEGGSGKDYRTVGTLGAVDGDFALGEADVGHLLRRVGAAEFALGKDAAAAKALSQSTGKRVALYFPKFGNAYLREVCLAGGTHARDETSRRCRGITYQQGFVCNRVDGVDHPVICFEVEISSSIGSVYAMHRPDEGDRAAREPFGPRAARCDRSIEMCLCSLDKYAAAEVVNNNDVQTFGKVESIVSVVQRTIEICNAVDAVYLHFGLFAKADNELTVEAVCRPSVVVAFDACDTATIVGYGDIVEVRTGACSLHKAHADISADIGSDGILLVGFALGQSDGRYCLPVVTAIAGAFHLEFACSIAIPSLGIEGDFAYAAGDVFGRLEGRRSALTQAHVI